MEGEPVYIEVPFEVPGYNKSKTVLRLKKSLYGQVDALKMWCNKLKKGLEARKLFPCKAVTCLFIGKKVICISYVDDCLWFARKESDIDDLLKSFEDDGVKHNWEMKIGGSVEEYLGITITRTSDGGYKLTQEGLIKKVLEATGMQDCNPEDTPTTSTGPLGKDINGKAPQRQHQWQYASVIGMMMCLTSNSRPDIAFAVHQCARFTHCVKASHENAVLRICKYLKGTQNDGLILRPNKKLKVECYADADFAGLYSPEEPEVPNGFK